MKNFFRENSGRVWENRLKITLGLVLVALFFNVGAWIYNPNSWRLGIFDPYATPRFLVGDVLILVALILGIGNFGKNLGVRRKQPKILTLVLILGILVLSSAIWGLNPSGSLGMVARWVELGLALLVFLRSGFAPRKGILILGIWGAVEAVIGWGQVLAQSSLGIWGESPLGREIAGVAKIELGSWKLVRAAGTFPHANIFGGILAMIFVLLWVQKKKCRGEKILLGILGSGIILSGSRSALVSVFLGVVVSVFWERQKWSRKTWGGILAALGVLILICGVRLWDANNSLEKRWQGSARALEIIAKKPMGVGLGNFTLALDEQAGLELWERQPVHNVPLLAVAELGILGAALWGLVAVIFLKRRWRWAPRLTMVILGSVAPLVLADHFFWDTPQGMIFGMVILWILWSAPRERARLEMPQRWKRQPRFPKRKYSRRR